MVLCCVVCDWRVLQPLIPDVLPSRAEVLERIGIAGRVGNNTHLYLCHQTLFKLMPEFDNTFRCVMHALLDVWSWRQGDSGARPRRVVAAEGAMCLGM